MQTELTALDKHADEYALKEFNGQEEAIADLREQYGSLEIVDHKSYDAVRIGIGELRTLRGSIERRRKSLNEEDMARIRSVNRMAWSLSDAISSVEAPLKQMKQAVDDEKTLAKREAEHAELKRIEDERQAVIAAEEAQRRAVHEAEQARLKIEADNLAAQRAELEAERKRMDAMLAQERAQAAEQHRLERTRLDAELAREEAKRKAEREKLEAERATLQAALKKIDHARRFAEWEELKRRADAETEHKAAEKVERDRLAAEQAARDKAAAELAERERVAALMPDREKVREFAKVIRALTLPSVTSAEAREMIDALAVDLNEIAMNLEQFSP